MAKPFPYLNSKGNKCKSAERNSLIQWIRRTHLQVERGRSREGPPMSVPTAQFHTSTPSILSLVTVGMMVGLDDLGGPKQFYNSLCLLLEDLAFMDMPDSSSPLKPNPSFWQQHAVRSRSEFMSAQRDLLAPIWFYVLFILLTASPGANHERPLDFSARQKSSKLYALWRPPKESLY